MIDFIFAVYPILLFLMTVAYVLNRWTGNMGIVDVFWGGGIVCVSSVMLMRLDSPNWVQFLGGGLIILWGLRLSGFLLVTRVLKKEKDSRYTQLQDKWDKNKEIKTLGNFYIQAILQGVMCVSLYPLFLGERVSWSIWHALGVVIFLWAIWGQITADTQLYRYKSHGGKGIFKQGLWAVSRHPNYFFEIMIWVSIALYFTPFPSGLVSWVSPLCIGFIVRFITGPYTEKLSLAKYQQAFRRYQAQVPMILPDFKAWIVNAVPLPDALYRWAIRGQLNDRLSKEYQAGRTDLIQARQRLMDQPITCCVEDANEQHYEVPTVFYDMVLGPKKKYSCCWFSEVEGNSPSHRGENRLAQAEDEMLFLTLERANIRDGHSILELGCGWGAITLDMGQRFPNSPIIAVSNSKTQKQYIEAEAKKRGLHHITVITEDVANFTPSQKFDRIISVEMLEHVRNYAQLFKRMSSWLLPEGQCFIHIFGHKELAYEFDAQLDKSWMSTYFFSGGQMPAKELFGVFNDNLAIVNSWVVNGQHYQKTCRLWLENMDKNKAAILPIFKDTYGIDATRFWIYWRLFFMACEELFGYNNGEEWQVYHYLLEPRKGNE